MQLAGVGVVDRRRRARPALHGLVEVLGAEDLDGVVDGDRGADRVRARAGLAPQRALGEVHRLGGAQAQARPLPSIAQQHAVGVGDHDEVARPRRRSRTGTRGSAARRGRADAPPSASCSLALVGDDGRERGAVGSTPAASERRHESAIASRTTAGSSSASAPSRRVTAETKCSQAKRSSRARIGGCGAHVDGQPRVRAHQPSPVLLGVRRGAPLSTARLSGEATAVEASPQ